MKIRQPQQNPARTCKTAFEVVASFGRLEHSRVDSAFCVHKHALRRPPRTADNRKCVSPDMPGHRQATKPSQANLWCPKTPQVLILTERASQHHPSAVENCRSAGKLALFMSIEAHVMRYGIATICSDAPACDDCTVGLQALSGPALPGTRYSHDAADLRRVC